MIPNTKDRSLKTGGVVSSGSFGISLEDSAHIMTILRDTLYSDKVLAVLREYSANAWDAQREAGKGSQPINVTLPTRADPTLRIQDNGPGLSQEGIFKVFAQYGASTKRNSDTAVGMLGIGSKSGFAYSDSFNVISCHGGFRRTYVAVLDSSEKGVINQLFEEPCGDETGVTIEIAIKVSDIAEFHEKAKNLFVFFEPRPICNIKIPEVASGRVTESKYGFIASVKDNTYKSGLSQEEGEVHFNPGAWFAKMGCIAYPIQLDQLKYEGSGIPGFLSRMAGVLYFDIGELQISASREELKYGDSTKTAISNKFSLLIEEFVRTTLEVVDKQDTTPWERLVRCRVLADMKLPIPKQWENRVMERAPLKDTPTTFILYRLKHAQRDIDLSSSNRILLKDEFRAMKGYALTRWDYILVRTGEKKAPWDEVRKELDKLLADSGLTGIPIENLSSVPWVKPISFRAPHSSDGKHNHRAFILDSFHLFPKSRNWTKVDGPTPPDSPFFIIENFSIWDCSDARDNYIVLKLLCRLMQKEVPNIYGFKRTAKEKLTYDSPGLGIPFPTWIVDFFKESLKDPNMVRILELSDWENNIHFLNFDYDLSKERKDNFSKVLKALSKTSPVRTLLEEAVNAHQEFRKLGVVTAREASTLFEWFEKLSVVSSKVEPRLKNFQTRYPLTNMTYRFEDVFEPTRALSWAEYFNLIDEKFKREDEKNGRASVQPDQRVGDSRLEGQVAHSQEGSTELSASA